MLMVVVVGMCDGAAAIVAVLSVVVISMVLDRCAECILEDLGQDIFHMYWDVTKYIFIFIRVGGNELGKMGNARESGIGRAVDYDGRCCAERCLAKVAHERAAHADHVDGRQSHVDDAHICIRLFRVLQCMRKHDVLLRDQSDSDTVTDGGVEEITDMFRGHVLYAFLKPTNQKKKVVL